MLPAYLKLTRPQQFKHVVRKGRRAGSPTVIVHMAPSLPASDGAVAGRGPRFGLIVSKAVGNAVVRHQTSRRLRHVALSLRPVFPEGVDVVFRALPAAATASSKELKNDVQRALIKLQRKR